MPTVTCCVCQKDFHKKPSRISRSRKHYCSFACRKKDATKTCDYCGKTFKSHLRGKARDRQRFCSVSCSNKARNPITSQSKPVACSNCGTMINRWNRDLKRYRYFYCSSDCQSSHHSTLVSGPHNPSWNGGHDDYRGSDWSKQRAKALERNGHSCQLCNTSQDEHIECFRASLTVHHIERYEQSKDNSLSNLVTLCFACHTKLEKS